MKVDQKDFRTFEDLEMYQVAREFRKAVYSVNRRLPSFEKFELGSQIRRAAVSLTHNISEGYGRYHYCEPIKFTLQARGSLQELIDDLDVCDVVLRETSPAYGFAEDDLDSILDDSTIQPFNDSTISK